MKQSRSVIVNGINCDLDQAHEHTTNREEIERSDLCGCFYCLATFPPVLIERWLGDGAAICPYCQIDSVVGSASGFPINDEFVKAMYQRWFS